MNRAQRRALAQRQGTAPVRPAPLQTPSVDVGAVLDAAVACHQQGRLAEAEGLYRQVLALDPGNADALHLLGVIAHQVGQHEIAVELIGAAIGRNPAAPTFHSNLGNALHALGRTNEAVVAFRNALALAPEYAEGHNNLGVTLKTLGRLDEAAGAFRRAAELVPAYADAHANLGIAMRDLGRPAEAVGSLTSALRLRPDHVDALATLGAALRDLGRHDEAAAHLDRALALAPASLDLARGLASILQRLGRADEALGVYGRTLVHHPEAAELHYELGETLAELGRADEAIGHFRRAVDLRPEYPEALASLGLALRALGRLEEAADAYRAAADLRPDSAELRASLGTVLQDQGRLGEAIATLEEAERLDPSSVAAGYNLANAHVALGCVGEALPRYRRILADRPDFVAARDNLLFGLLYDPDVDPAELLAEHRRWGNPRGHRPDVESHPNRPDSERRLRVGFVSPDFRQHAVMSLFAPLLDHLDRERVELFCYATTGRHDAVTERVRATATFRDIAGLSDDEAAALVRADGVDVLVDLACHTAGNRLGLFARKPAPVQVTHNVMTTGLDAVDYLISDRHLAPDLPPGAIAERLWRLPDVHMCWAPPADAPPVAPPPALAGGHVTFGSFNNLAKLGDPVLRLWARVLAAVPDSRLLLKGSLATDAGARAVVAERLAACGLDPSRVELLPRADRPEDHLAAYGRVDIGLDPFPFNGCTTTCEALWMGVPVVTLAGQLFADRVGAAFLRTAGLPELVAEDAASYVEIAARLAADLPRLAAHRAGLRERMAASPLCDGPAYADAFGEALRAMWRAWCLGREAAA